MTDAEDLEREVGNPAAKWDELKARVQAEAIHQFADVEEAWLDLMWTLDAYRVAQILPAGFKDFGAFNRGKGNGSRSCCPCSFTTAHTTGSLRAREYVASPSTTRSTSSGLPGVRIRSSAASRRSPAPRPLARRPLAVR